MELLDHSFVNARSTSCVSDDIAAANSISQILQNRRHPMKCNQWGFCLGISGYSTLQNRRHSEEFCSLVFTSQFNLTAHQKYCKTVDTLRNTINGAFA